MIPMLGRALLPRCLPVCRASAFVGLFGHARAFCSGASGNECLRRPVKLKILLTPDAGADAIVQNAAAALTEN